MLRWLALGLGLCLAVFAHFPLSGPSSARAFWVLVLGLYLVAQGMAPSRFPLSAAVFVVLVSSPQAGSLWVLATALGVSIRALRKHSWHRDALPEVWSAAIAGVSPWLVVPTYALASFQRVTLSSCVLLLLMGGVATRTPPELSIVLLVASLLVGIPVQAQLNAEDLARAQVQEDEQRQSGQIRLQALDERSLQLDLRDKELQLQLRSLELIGELFRQSSRVSQANQLYSDLLLSLQRIIPGNWLGLFRPDGSLFASIGDAKLQPEKCPPLLDRARPNLSQVGDFHQVVAQEREFILVRGYRPFEEAQLEVLQRFLPHLPMCLDAIRFQDSQARALTGEQSRRQELHRMVGRLTSMRDLISHLVSCRGFRELITVAQDRLAQWAPRYQAEITWRGKVYAPVGSLALTKNSHDYSWPIIVEGREQGKLRLTAAVGEPLSELDSELLRLCTGQFSSLLEMAELNQELSATVQQLKLSQARLMHAAKLAAVGQLAAGVAHELNTPLGAITVGCDMVSDLFASNPSKAQAVVDNMAASAERMQFVISKLLIYGGHHSGERRAVNLRDLVQDTLVLLPGHQAQIHFRPGPPWRAVVNPSEIQEVLRHLLLNALDSGAHHIEVWIESSSAGIAIHVKDDGSGMPPEVSERVYDPFFTTKKVGEGSGLGLFTSLQLAQQHNGSLTHQTSPGQGSTFSLILPAGEAES